MMTYERIYEINTRVWLWELVAQRVMARPNLAEIPQHFIDTWQRWGMDAVWLMGVWEPSPHSAQAAQADPHLVAACQQTLDDFTLDDCVSSPYAVRRYEVSALLGGLDALLALRARLQQAGLGLILDFVPNHTACDHPWVRDHPEYYVQGTTEDVAQAPEAYFQADTVQGTVSIAHGRDPYFPPWTDTAQLNYGRQELHAAMQAELLRLAEWCDGVRCDMAMLCLSEIFSRTWSLAVSTPQEFWPTAIQAIQQRFPNFCFMAEVYWQLETRLHQLGFTLTYDKDGYDALVAQDPARFSSLLHANWETLAAHVRFLENHDEAQAATHFSPAQTAAAMMAILTLPGTVLVHDGQIEGRQYHTPVQLRRRRVEAAQPAYQDLYERLFALPQLPQDAFYLLHPHMAWEDNPTFRGMLAWAWEGDGRTWLVVINDADVTAQCAIVLADLVLPTEELLFQDHWQHATYTRNRTDLQHKGLYVELPPFGSHVFEIIPA